jgi:uncharacterized protein
MFYLDTSFIVASLTPHEIRSDDARDWLDANNGAPLAVSDWVKTEVSSAFSLKIRTNQLDLEQRAAALQQWSAFLHDSLSVIALDSRDFETAARFAERHDLSLRAGDALHIAVAQHASCTLVTLDQKMADAAIILGVPVAAI